MRPQTYLKVPLESQNGRIDRLICELWEFVQALEEGRDVFSELGHLLWEILWVQVSRNYGGPDVWWRLRPITPRLRRPAARHLGGRVLMLDFSGEQVRSILVEEMENPGDSLAKVVGG